jgi:hypothetical protein
MPCKELQHGTDIRNASLTNLKDLLIVIALCGIYVITGLLQNTVDGESANSSVKSDFRLV